jgi:hypothetical protein
LVGCGAVLAATPAAAEPKLGQSWADIPLAEPEGGEFDTRLELPRGLSPPAAPSATYLDPAGQLPPEPPAAGLDARLKWEGNAGSSLPGDPATAGSANAISALGVKYKLQPDIMLGVLAQFDQAGGAVTSGPGSPPSQQPWLAGPVATVKLAPGLVFDARAAWGAGETTAVDHGGVPGTWTTERRLIDAKLASTQSYGHWRFSPTVTLNYAEEKPSVAAPDARAVGAGRIDVTPELAYRIELPQAMFIEPKAAIGSYWGIDDLSRLAPGGSAQESLHLKAGAGVTIGSTDGTKLEVGAGVEGGGPAAPEVWTGRLQLSVPLK